MRRTVRIQAVMNLYKIIGSKNYCPLMWAGFYQFISLHNIII